MKYEKYVRIRTRRSMVASARDCSRIDYSERRVECTLGTVQIERTVLYIVSAFFVLIKKRQLLNNEPDRSLARDVSQPGTKTVICLERRKYNGKPISNGAVYRDERTAAPESNISEKRSVVRVANAKTYPGPDGREIGNGRNNENNVGVIAEANV